MLGRASVRHYLLAALCLCLVVVAGIVPLPLEASQTTPVSPVSPVSPVPTTPVSPVSPVSPVPTTPVSPGSPVSPVTPVPSFLCAALLVVCG
jgi:hypothetical protein